MASAALPPPVVAISSEDADHEASPAPSSFLSTPEVARRSSALGATEHALASSPILRGNDLSPMRALSDRPSARNSYRTSIASSFRLSRDLDDLRWDGSPLREDDAMFNGDENTRRGYQAGSESEGEPSQRGPGEHVTYSSLSKRADLILANAKKKLNLLEGNLGRARHSLVIAPQTLSELNRSDSTASTQSAPFLSKDEERLLEKGPKITFGTPRRTAIGAGHSRVFSDTSIPSQSGSTPAGSRSLDYMRNRDFGTRHPLHKASQDLLDNSLDSVPEDQVTTGAKHSTSNEDEPSSRRSSSSSNKDLQSQAEQLRSRISYLQSRSRDSSLRRRSLNGDFNIMSAHAEENEADVEASNATHEPLHTDLDHDPRAEWQRVLEKRATGSDDSGSYIGDEDEDDYEDGKLPDALADEILDEDDPDALDQPHETRNDAFDYEHFILHSIMGNSVRPGSSASSTTASVDHSFDGPEDEAGWIDSSQLNEQLVAPSDDADRSESDSDSDRDDVHDSLNKSWPVPPSVRNSSSTKGTTPASSFRHNRNPSNRSKGSKASASADRRPESEIVAKLIAPAHSPSTAPLVAEDRALFYAVAESFREVCLRLQHGNLGPHDGVDLRQRLEIARRVLKGEL
ncbi:hypothetical protein FH972_022147 [Carpinus fangiana]|uniref:Uncharacterized protein n=1 Tax=Carpinus fangiana TaxID=176857 RepID=A0A5N6KRX6_9ROSI|nr:hypothetical protein FH972_022147 [Carpinus fangiana]